MQWWLRLCRAVSAFFPSGGASIGDGTLVSAGISQLENFDIYFQVSDSSQNGINGGDEETDNDAQNTETPTEVDIEKEYREQALSESEKMKEGN